MFPFQAGVIRRQPHRCAMAIFQRAAAPYPKTKLRSNPGTRSLLSRRVQLTADRNKVGSIDSRVLCGLSKELEIHSVRQAASVERSQR